MADHTSVNPEDLRTAAKRIGEIMNPDVMAVFTNLSEGASTGGAFPTSAWLHERVADRVKAMQRQAETLKGEFSYLSTGLTNVADNIHLVDENNGKRIHPDRLEGRDTGQHSDERITPSFGGLQQDPNITEPPPFDTRRV